MGMHLTNKFPGNLRESRKLQEIYGMLAHFRQGQQSYTGAYVHFKPAWLKRLAHLSHTRSRVRAPTPCLSTSAWIKKAKQEVSRHHTRGESKESIAHSQRNV